MPAGVDLKPVYRNPSNGVETRITGAELSKPSLQVPVVTKTVILQPTAGGA